MNLPEKIKLEQSRTGTTATFFSPHLGDSNLSSQIDSQVFPSYLTFDQQGQPESIGTFSGNTIWFFDRTSNNYIPIQNVTNDFVTGYSFTRTSDTIFDEQQKQSTRDTFKNRIENAFTSSTSPNNFVFFEDEPIDDMFIDININRSRKTLDTLSIFNKPINSVPERESDTGVVMGKLEALQKVEDIYGNRIRIPLRNVPVGIFNPSDKFPSTTSRDENGDRIVLNLKEASEKDEYFNEESFDTDNRFLRSASNLTKIPEHYKFITKTNDNGEFIIHNAPTGTQNLIFEVDLLKQGLTKDEVALNFFPYPSSEQVQVDNVPHYFFRQIPVTVVPSWGDAQSGYTELNVTANLDLRKWATYFIPPVAIDDQTLEETRAGGALENLNIDIRDMSKEDFPVTNIQMVEVHDILQRETDQYLSWQQEFSQNKERSKFFETDYFAIKLPANIYDPNKNKTDRNGKEINSEKGAWFCGYQLKMNLAESSNVFRATGFESFWVDGGLVGRDHFRLNRGNDDLSSGNTNTEGSQVGNFPYEQPWTSKYPDEVKIPEKPSEENYPQFWNINGSGKTPVVLNSFPVLEDPRFSDGELIGFSTFDDGFGGYGAQFLFEEDLWFGNNFSKKVTKNFIYRYENRTAWDEEYASGYRPNFPQNELGERSKVINGERYQRVEAGYGYWVRPEGWPRISRQPWGSDTIFGKDIEDRKPVFLEGNSVHGNFYSISSYNVNTFNLDGRKLALALGNKASKTEGYLDLYRVINPKSSNLIDPIPPETPTFGHFHFQEVYVQKTNRRTSNFIRTGWNNTSGAGGERYFFKMSQGPPADPLNGSLLEITNRGSKDIEFLNPFSKQKEEIKAGQSVDVNIENNFTFSNMVLILPGNDGFNIAENKYERVNYDFRVKGVTFKDGNGGTKSGSHQDFDQQINDIDRKIRSNNNRDGFYLVTRTKMETNFETTGNVGCKNRFRDRFNIFINGLVMISPEQNNGKFHWTVWANKPGDDKCEHKNLKTGIFGVPNGTNLIPFVDESKMSDHFPGAEDPKY